MLNGYKCKRGLTKVTVNFSFSNKIPTFSKILQSKSMCIIPLKNKSNGDCSCDSDKSAVAGAQSYPRETGVVG